MSLKETFKHMKDLLANITTDLEKSEGGNKAAAQRVRTGTVKLEKVAKAYRKESISSEKKTKGQARPKAASKAKAKHKAAPKKHAAASHHHAKAKTATVKAKPRAKATTSYRSRHLSIKKRATAKIPTRKSFR